MSDIKNRRRIGADEGPADARRLAGSGDARGHASSTHKVRAATRSRLPGRRTRDKRTYAAHTGGCLMTGSLVVLRARCSGRGRVTRRSARVGDPTYSVSSIRPAEVLRGFVTCC